MYALTHGKIAGQLVLEAGYEILDFKRNASSITVTTKKDTKKVRLNFGANKVVMIYSSTHNNPILTLGGN